MNNISFKIITEDTGSKARTGLLKTAHGNIRTPIFMPVGTLGSVKSVKQESLRESIGAQIILGNTYHLYLRPGIHILEKAGGLHQFMQWERPILTDSGGYQVYSLAESRKIKEEGVFFQSHIDGSKMFIGPEESIAIQKHIGGDIIMAFDECPPLPSERKYILDSMHMTHRWLDRCILAMNKQEELYGYEQTLFPIIQGGDQKDLRKQSAEYCSERAEVGLSIGGLSVGEPPEVMYEMTDVCTNIMPKNKARYLMGVGKPENILNAIALGIDMFDCVLPTRNARNGMIFTENGFLNIKNKKWEDDFSAIDENLSPNYSKAYLRHLIQNNEYLGAVLASEQNLKFYLWLVNEAQKQIELGHFSVWKDKMIEKVTHRL